LICAEVVIPFLRLAEAQNSFPARKAIDEMVAWPSASETTDGLFFGAMNHEMANPAVDSPPDVAAFGVIGTLFVAIFGIVGGFARWMFGVDARLKANELAVSTLEEVRRENEKRSREDHEQRTQMLIEAALTNQRLEQISSQLGAVLRQPWDGVERRSR
jgi:hypothetical protein